MRIAFQDTNIDLNEVNKNCEALKSLGVDPILFGVIPFTDSLAVAFDSPTLLFGSVKILKLFLAQRLPKNAVVFYDRHKFDQLHYQEALKEELLNYGARFVRYGYVKNDKIEDPIFIKPSSDIKYFTGCIICPPEQVLGEAASLYPTLGSILSVCQMIDSDFTDETVVLVNKNIVKIESEYRCFVINNRLIDVTMYKYKGKVCTEHVRDTGLTSYVEKIKGIYHPHYHYCIDIAKLESGELKVIEYNCINCSGVYAADRQKIYSEFLKL
jgi:hypothetical protein